MGKQSKYSEVKLQYNVNVVERRFKIVDNLKKSTLKGYLSAVLE